MKKLVILLLMLSFYSNSFAQIISRHEADSLLSVLKNTKTDTAQVRLLLQVAKFHIFKPGEYKQDLDSALSLINQAAQLNKSIHSLVSEGNMLLVKAYYFRENGQRDLAKQSVEHAIAVLKNEKPKYLLGEAYFELSEYYAYETELEKKTSLVQQAIACFDQYGPIERKAYYYKVLGDLFYMKDMVNTTKALEALDSSLTLYKSIDYPGLQSVYILYSTIYAFKSDYKHALNYALLAVQSAEKVKDTSMQLCQIYNVTGAIFAHLHEYEKANQYLRNALSVAEKNHDIHSIYAVLFNICANYLTINKATEAREVLDKIVKTYPQPTNPEIALQQLQIRISISKQLNQLGDLEYYCGRLVTLLTDNNFGKMSSVSAYLTIITGYLKLKSYPLALKFLKKGQEELELLPFSAVNTKFYNLWFSLDTATRDYKSAVYHLLEYNKANDTIFNQTKMQQIQQLEVDYDLKGKEKNIQLLRQEKIIREIDLKRSALLLKQTALIRNIIIAAAAFLLVILFLLFNQFRLKQRNNKIVEKKNAVLQHLVEEKEWLLKEVHHRVKNNLQTVVSLLELQSENLRDEALSAIHDSQNRIYAMSLIHQKLYQTDNIASINMQPYLLELTNHLQAIYNPEKTISFDLQVAPLELDVSQAIPVGLIVNEAVTNSIKYAFNYPAHHPQISIVLNQYKKQRITLTIADNGIGLPPHFNSTDATGLGFKLMNGLVDDIEGKLMVESEEGTLIQVVFYASVPFDEKVQIPKPEKAFAV